jgi:SAM-dependent methyltransferase
MDVIRASQAYWHQRYVRELDEVKFAAQSEDPMEKLFVWFGKVRPKPDSVLILSRAEHAIRPMGFQVQLLLAAQTISSEIVGLDKERACIVDVGCGNGFFCEVLHAMGFRNLTGTDYSPAAVRLCNHVQKHFRKDAREWGTRYVVDNILWTRLEPASFDLVHDSGTLDSIAMTIAEDTPVTRHTNIWTHQLLFANDNFYCASRPLVCG